MAAPLVFIDLAGPDAEALKDFYARIFGWQADAGGQFSVPMGPALLGAFRQDPAEKRLYLGVDDVAGCLERILDAGGSVDQPRFEVPGVVVLGLFKDPAGNPMGLVEMDGAAPKVP